MSQITDFIKTELYPSLFDYIDIAFPEHDFKQYSEGWKSKTYLNGTAHSSREDKTKVTKKNIGRIFEQGGEGKSLVDYVIERDKVDFITAVETLAKVVNLSLPQNRDFNQEEYKAKKQKEELLEVVNDYFKFCLSKANGKPQSLYLDMRGYDKDIIEIMEMGKAPEPEKIKAYLELKKYSKDAVDSFIKTLPKGVGTTHALTIPYRVGGVIKGYIFRVIDEAIKPKYLFTIGLEKSKGFFNIPARAESKDLVIVEGLIDALHPTAKGLNNIVATGGVSVSPEQIKDALKRGFNSFTICFDTEPEKEEQTQKNVNRVIEVILGEGVNKIYVATLPQVQQHPTKVDADSYVRDRGVEGFNKVIQEAIPYYEYKLNSIINQYGKLEETQGELYPRDVDSLQEEVIKVGSTIVNPLDKDRYKKLFIDFEPIKELGITEESLSITLDNLTSSKEKQDQSKELNKLLAEVKGLQDKGETFKALELLEGKVKEVKLKDKATEFSSLLLPNTEEGIMERQTNKPESLKTSYNIGDEELLIPSGAISVLCAPTSHGKTTLLLNLALDVAEKNPEKSFYIFSYEEDRDAVTTSALNIYQGKELSRNNRKSISGYFATGGSTEYFKSEPGLLEGFKAKKDQFFKELIETNRLNIQYSNYNSDTLIDAIRYLAKNTNAGGVFIDYIQLLNLPQGKYKTYSRQEEIKEICIALKDVAVETGLPIVLGAQFNRTVLNQLDLHATKIGEAGDIERIANLIVGFWNNAFNPMGTEGEIKEINDKGINLPNTIYTTILKNRGGRVGVFDNWSFNGNIGNISNQSNTGNNYFK